MRSSSEEFAALWETGDVAVRRGGRKRIVHAELGIVDVHCQNLFSEDGRQRLQFFTAPPGGSAVDQLRLLAVIAFSSSSSEQQRPAPGLDRGR